VQSKSKELKPVRCACGKSAKVKDAAYVSRYRVVCARVMGDGRRQPYMYDSCFIGPEYASVKRAIRAWNKVMERVR
jgi:hypothetical protein